jgi:hypothetical protein
MSGIRGMAAPGTSAMDNIIHKLESAETGWVREVTSGYPFPMMQLGK